MNIELKPCPFCGGQPRLVEETSLAKVACMNRGCDVEPETPWFWSVDEAAEAWNTRAERTCRVLSKLDGGSISPVKYAFSCRHVAYRWSFEPPKYCQECGAKVVDE